MSRSEPALWQFRAIIAWACLKAHPFFVSNSATTPRNTLRCLALFRRRAIAFTRNSRHELRLHVGERYSSSYMGSMSVLKTPSGGRHS